MSRRRVFQRIPIALVVVALACAAPPVRAAEIDPDADAILRQMSDHLAGLKAFSVTTDVSTELILRNGQKIQLTASGAALFDRERGFSFMRKGRISDLELTFDGRRMTLYLGELNEYRTIEVEGGNDAALDEVRAAFGIEASGGIDLLYSNPYEGLLYGVESGAYYGESWIGGVKAHHLAYRAADIDWQLWVSAEGEPLPVKYVITSKWMTGAPQFSVQLHDWNSSVSVSEADVTFVPPDGAREFEASPVDELGIAGTE
jgi:hypothetical protein